MVVSIHAPTRGATLSICQSPTIGMFQSTLPRGERQNYEYTKTKLEEFQSTLPRGERHPQQVLSNDEYMFQSTLPRGERPSCIR